MLEDTEGSVVEVDAGRVEETGEEGDAGATLVGGASSGGAGGETWGDPPQDAATTRDAATTADARNQEIVFLTLNDLSPPCLDEPERRRAS